MQPIILSMFLLGSLPEDANVDYLRDVKPILAGRCNACHAAIKQKGSLRVDTAAFLFEGGDNGPALIAGKSSESLLVKRILGQDNLSRMPPPSDGEALKPAQIALIRRWIDQGAAAPKDEQAETDPRDHWAFKTPLRPGLPAIKSTSWVRNPVDAFIAKQHERQGLTPQPAIDKRLLLRRVYLDLTGLPPTASEMIAFVSDPSPQAYEKVVNRLLDSSQYGERWGRNWMDIWRYSDWWGLGQELRNSQKHMWHWRDWIVESVNKDKGYDRMVLEMLAADELFPTDDDAVRGTGFLARHYFKFNRTTWLDETIEHTSKAFLGITMNCSKCHDHKYDPLSQVDYYRFRAFFEPYQIRLDLARGEIDLEKDGVPRVFDCNLEAPTYLHIRGNEQSPDKGRDITPGLPRFFTAKNFAIEPVHLPAEAHHPGLRPHVLESYLQAAEKDLAAARLQLEQAQAQLVLAEKPGKVEAKSATVVDAKKIRAALAVAEKLSQAAIENIAALKARAAADRARTAASPPANAKELATQAALAEKKHAVAKADADLARAEEQLLKGTGKDVAVKQAQAALDVARKAFEKPGDAYTPLAGALKTLESNLENDASRRKPFPKISTGRRTALAKWIADRDNPLTARVAVNHMWARHFGQPLVASVFDFGRKGAAPTHPDLLDWLAVEFMENGWSMKHMHRLIVTSNAYRMTSSVGPALQAVATNNREKDPDNLYLWRMNTQRMESQVVRDSLLHLAGELDLTLGGKSIEASQQEASKRRSLYFFHSAIERNRFLTTFDEADPLDCYRRRDSIVPQQALALSNSTLALTMADKISQRLDPQAALPDRDFARAAFTLVLGHDANDEELSACEQAMERWKALSQTPARTRSSLVHALLNHNDFITIR